MNHKINQNIPFPCYPMCVGICVTVLGLVFYPVSFPLIAIGSISIAATVSGFVMNSTSVNDEESLKSFCNDIIVLYTGPTFLERCKLWVTLLNKRVDKNIDKNCDQILEVCDQWNTESFDLFKDIF
jgi:hypothetical protein